MGTQLLPQVSIRFRKKVENRSTLLKSLSTCSSIFILQAAALTCSTKSRDLFRSTTVIFCKNKWRSNYKSEGSLKNFAIAMKFYKLFWACPGLVSWYVVRNYNQMANGSTHAIYLAYRLYIPYIPHKYTLF